MALCDSMKALVSLDLDTLDPARLGLTALLSPLSTLVSSRWVS